MLPLSTNALTHILLISSLLVTYAVVSRAQLKVSTRLLLMLMDTPRLKYTCIKQIWVLFKNTPAERFLSQKTFTDHDLVEWRQRFYSPSLIAIASIVITSNFVFNSWFSGIIDNIFTLFFLFPAFFFSEMVRYIAMRMFNQLMLGILFSDYRRITWTLHARCLLEGGCSVAVNHR